MLLIFEFKNLKTQFGQKSTYVCYFFLLLDILFECMSNFVSDSLSHLTLSLFPLLNVNDVNLIAKNGFLDFSIENLEEDFFDNTTTNIKKSFRQPQISKYLLQHS